MNSENSINTTNEIKKNDSIMPNENKSIKLPNIVKEDDVKFNEILYDIFKSENFTFGMRIKGRVIFTQGQDITKELDPLITIRYIYKKLILNGEFSFVKNRYIGLCQLKTSIFDTLILLERENFYIFEVFTGKRMRIMCPSAFQDLEKYFIGALFFDFLYIRHGILYKKKSSNNKVLKNNNDEFSFTYALYKELFHIDLVILIDILPEESSSRNLLIIISYLDMIGAVTHLKNNDNSSNNKIIFFTFFVNIWLFFLIMIPNYAEWFNFLNTICAFCVFITYDTGKLRIRLELIIAQILLFIIFQEKNGKLLISLEIGVRYSFSIKNQNVKNFYEDILTFMS